MSPAARPSEGGGSVLVLVELADTDHALLREALLLARTRRETIHLVYVAPDPHRTGAMEFELADYVDRITAENAAARHRLARLSHALGRQGYHVRVTILERWSRQAIRSALDGRSPAAVVVRRSLGAPQRYALRHGISHLMLAAGAWLIELA